MAARLAAGAAGCALLMFVSGQRSLVWLTLGLMYGALFVHRRTVAGQRFASWIAWEAGAVASLLLAWVQPGAARLILVPWAGVSAVVGLVLLGMWRSHRAG